MSNNPSMDINFAHSNISQMQTDIVISNIWKIRKNAPYQNVIYVGQSISNASIFFSPLLFKKTQIHSLKTTTLTINLSLFNTISIHFHRFGPPFNKGMYSSPVKSKVLSPKPLTHGRFHLVCPSASLQKNQNGGNGRRLYWKVTN